MKSKGWIGVDLDGTLAFYDGWQGIGHVGEPIEPMLARVRRWLDEGREVRILTARVSSAYKDRSDAAQHIQDWTEKHLGVRLAVTCEKDFAMIELWDDRAVTVELNTGRALAPSSRGLDTPKTNQPPPPSSSGCHWCDSGHRDLWGPGRGAHVFRARGGAITGSDPCTRADSP